MDIINWLSQRGKSEAVKIFITDDTDLMGRALVNELHQHDLATRTFDNGSHAFEENPLSETIPGDISHVFEYADYVKGCDAVVCNASIIRRLHAAPTEELPECALMRAAYQQGVSHFISVSSVKVFGVESVSGEDTFGDDEPLAERNDLLDSDARVLQNSERELSALAQELSMPLTIIHTGTLYANDVAPVTDLITPHFAVFAGFGNNHLPFLHADSLADLVTRVIQTKSDPSQVENLNAVPAHSDTARAVYRRWKRENNAEVRTLFLPIPVYRLYVLATHTAKRVLKRNIDQPSVEYVTKEGTRNIDYSATRAYKKYGWIGY